MTFKEGYSPHDDINTREAARRKSHAPLPRSCGEIEVGVACDDGSSAKVSSLGCPLLEALELVSSPKSIGIE